MDILQSNIGGFNFENVSRNKMLEKNGFKMPKFQKTGTTICGLCYKDGVVLGADTRATCGPVVADKNCFKIHRISDQIWVCGAGTSADCDNLTALMSSQLELHRLETGLKPRVITCISRIKQRLFRYGGYIQAALVVGGVDSTGSHLYTVFPHGSTDRLPFASMGSGSLAAMSVLEDNYKEDLDEKEACRMVDQAIQAGIFNDLGSGSNVDICIIRNNGTTEMMRNIHERKLTERKYRRQRPVHFPLGSTEIIEGSEEFQKAED